MSNIKSIRERLGVTQAELAVALGMTQGNVSFYERGQKVPPDVASRLIEYAGTRGHIITFNDIYSPELAQAPATIAQVATELVAAESVDIVPAGALRTGAVRRHQVRRAKDLPLDVDRRAKSGPPFQSLEKGVA